MLLNVVDPQQFPVQRAWRDKGGYTAMMRELTS